MSERIRFHLDENVDPAIALGLRRYGIDVTTTNDVELRTQSDEVQLAFIQETQRVLFTQDTDFSIIASSRLDPNFSPDLSNRSAEIVGAG